MIARYILIVDDEPRVAFFLSKALEHTNPDYQVSIAHSGEEALEILNASPVDLLITDLRLPGINGLDLMRWVRTSKPKTRTILITAYGNDEIEAEAHRLEAYRYITKPFNLNDFTQVVQEALDDMAICQPGLIVLSDTACQSITQQLESLQQDIQARCILLADMQGKCLIEVGSLEDLDIAALLPLLAAGFATTGELDRRFGGGEAADFNFHQGAKYEIYSDTVGSNLFLAMLYERSIQSSRIGLVWLYTRHAIERLLTVLSTSEKITSMPRRAKIGGVDVQRRLDRLAPWLSSPVDVPGEDPDLDIAAVKSFMIAELGVPLQKDGDVLEAVPGLVQDDVLAYGTLTPRENGKQKKARGIKAGLTRDLIPSAPRSAPK